MKLFLVTTETSGDLLAGSMLAELQKTMPDLSATGVGGDRCLQAGMQPLYSVRDFNVMGLVEVLSQLKRLRGIFDELVTYLEKERADVLVLVDAPDFNLRFAKAVRHLGIPIIYYVSPQVWAWRKGRARQIADLVDHMMVLFDFETEIYEGLGLKTTWVGHPLVDELRDFGKPEDFAAAHGLDPAKPLVALAPGSRGSVVGKLLPVMAEVARQRSDRYQFAVPLASTIDREDVLRILDNDRVAVIPGGMRALMSHAHAAIVASGTGTLETGLLKTPMIMGYRLKRLSYLMGKMLVDLPHVALVNIVLNKGVVPELIQKDFRPEKIIPMLDELVNDGPMRSQMLAEFARLEEILGGSGASRRAAQVVRGYF
ncbi:MAG: lipid-A-disaccharide synthase [Acidobacteriota bacterium]|nr:lipid-A-disaccharide synthase [Acidobacteriota bacterium]